MKELTGENRCNRSKLTMEDARYIRTWKSVYSYKQLAEEFNVHVNTIKQIVKEKTHKEVDTKE